MMKLTDPAKESLLNDLMTEGKFPERGDDADAIVTLVRSAKSRRATRRVQWMGLMAGLVPLGLALAIFAGRLSETAPLAGGRDAGNEVVDSPTIASPRPTMSGVARIDDDALLDLLETTPSAVVEWPDGRRSLLLVVGEARAPSY